MNARVSAIAHAPCLVEFLDEIVERAFVGLVPESEPNSLARGEASRFRISNILPDGKLLVINGALNGTAGYSDSGNHGPVHDGQFY